MKLYDLLDKKELEDALAARLINIRTSGTGLDIYNYSKAAMYTDGAWDIHAVRACRGLVVNHETQEIVARPWEKFFNWQQKEAGQLDFSAPVEVTDKIDGSLGILVPDTDGTIRVATRGSFDSDQAIWATQWLRDRIPPDEVPYWHSILEALTFLVEIVYPDNRIVVDYKGEESLTLLGVVSVDTGKYCPPKDYTAKALHLSGIAEIFPFSTLREAIEAPPRPNKEGMVIRFTNENKLVKVKYEEYLKLHALFSNLNERRVWEYRVDEGMDATIDPLLAVLPDEFHPWVREVDNRLHDMVECEEHKVEAEYQRICNELLKDEYTDKDFALAVAQNPMKHKLFAVHRGFSLKPSIVKELKQQFLPDSLPPQIVEDFDE